MSTPRWVKSRLKGQAGFSIAAAVVFAAILTVAALVIQATVPTTVDPHAQGAAIGVPADPSAGTEPVVEDASCRGPRCPSVVKPPDKSKEIKENCVPGKDFSVDEVKGGAPFITPYTICDGTRNDVPATKLDTSATKFKSTFGTNDGRCIVDPKTGNLIPDPSKPWVCKKIWCVPKNIQILKKDSDAQNAGGVWKDPSQPEYDGSVCWDAKDNKTGAVDVNSVRADGAVQILPFLDPADRRDAAINLNFGVDDPGLNKAIAGAFKEEVGETALELKQIQEDKAAQIQLIADCTGDAKTSDPKCSSFSEADAKKRLEEIKKQEADLKERLDYLTKSQKALDPATAPDPKAPCDPSDPKCKTPEPRPTGGDKYNPSGPTGPSGSPFGNPSMNAGNTAQSPFGGACNTRYVCSGNTLYYQSQNGQQCMTQPMQQCQFGCQQVGATAGAAGGQTSMLSTITQALPLITSVMGMLGGGGSNNTAAMANPNLSSSCATQQQQQSPYGTGTNGQPCTQPPQQPPQSQCTSGTWKATSAQQNGCTTGWQCVSGNGTDGGQPTAQLSCQPQVADVGMQIGFSWSCANSSGSAGTGFDTGGQVSGNTTAVAPAPPENSNNTATYTLTCVNLGVTASAQCQVQVGKSGIVLIANPQQVRSGETSQIGWITSGMKSCVVSSPDQNDFTQKNVSTTNVNGAAQTSPITKTTTFKLDCVTVGGLPKSVTTTVGVN